MRIRRMLGVAMGASIGLIVLLVLSLWLMSISINRANSGIVLASEIRDTVFARVTLRDDYFINRGERAKAQWLSKTDLLSTQMIRARETFLGSKDREILAEMDETYTAILSLFQRLIANTEGRVTRVSEQSLAVEYDSLLFNQLNIKASILVDDSSKLLDLRFAEISALRRASDWLYSSCLAAVVAMVLVNGSLIGRILSKGIRRLQGGVASIGGGNLGYRLAEDSRDEISDLARGINSMAEALAASFTSIKSLDERIAQRTAELGASNKELEAFAYSVAHDLRAPLRSIDGFSRLLQEESGPTLDAEGRRLIGVIRDGAKEMDALISNLLEIARLGRTELAFSMIDMDSMARSTFSSLADPKTLSGFDFLVGELPDAYADPVMIERVWINLLANAVKYSIPSSTHRIEVSGREDGETLVYSVADRGVGFDERYKEKLFGMFQRLHDKKDFEGTGIGLAIVDRVIARHGGKVWAEGHIGEGATFYFSLPSNQGARNDRNE